MVLDNIQIIEALLFASDSPVAATKLKDIIGDMTVPQIKKLITEINDRYENNNSPLQIIEIAEGYQIVTRKEYANWIAKLIRSRNVQRLTKKALETLAIVAYKQPITKIEIENIRGVGSDAVIRTLIERNLITVVGREKAPGNPLLYGTTRFFMEYFGLKDLNHLPQLKEIDELLKGDEQFLESIDQVALEQLHPEALGIASGESDPDNGNKPPDSHSSGTDPHPSQKGTNEASDETEENDAAQ